MKVVHVAVGVVCRDERIFVTLRPDDVHQGGLWEFPGGKVEANETVQEALSRELFEEIGIDVRESTPLTVITHDYGDKVVKLDVHSVTAFSGEPHGKEGQAHEWVEKTALDPDRFPVANVAIIDALLA